MATYYNEFDKKKCAALKQLMNDGLISKGEIDDRPIQDVEPGDLSGFKRCHFFAGIGCWDVALDISEWTGPVWTGSCPCQPFSTAGKKKAGADERHLWPEWNRLISKCRPPIIFGEQVASAIAAGWSDVVFDDLETEDYACGSAVLPALSVGSPTKRYRLWFVADAESEGERRKVGNVRKEDGGQNTGLLREPHSTSENTWAFDCFALDGKGRRVPAKSDIRPLVNGFVERLGVIHCAGDAILPALAAEFITSYMEIKQ